MPKLEPPDAYFTDSKALDLLRAALAGDQGSARRLVAEGADPNAEGRKANPNKPLRLLQYAVASKSEPGVRTLILVGADPELSSPNTGSAFTSAMMLDDIALLSVLLEHRSASSLSQETLRKLMFGAVSAGRPRGLALLLDRGAPLDLPDTAGYSLLMRALDALDFDMAANLLQRGASLDVEAATGATAANSVQDKLTRAQPGSEAHRKLLELKRVMEQRGVRFPVPTAQENRERRTLNR